MSWASSVAEWEPIQATASPENWSKPLVVLTDPETYSACEDFLMGLADQPSVTVRGEPSGGGSGRLRAVRLLPGHQLTVTTCHTATLDHHIIEGNGHPVDGPITRDLIPAE